MSFLQSNEMPRMNHTLKHSYRTSFADLVNFEERQSVLFTSCDQSIVTIDIHDLNQRCVEHDGSLISKHSLQDRYTQYECFVVDDTSSMDMFKNLDDK